MLDAPSLDQPARVALRRVVGSVSPLVGWYRAGARALPGALVIGAQRAGTTSLHRLLLTHPQLRPPRRQKGVHYFDLAPTKSLAWYRRAFPVVHGDEMTFETSPYYLFHPTVPDRVARALPDVKVVALLRDPVERAVSHHQRETARGYEQLPLEAALDAEAERLQDSEAALRRDLAHVDFAHLHYGYVARGLYADQLERWIAALGRARVLAVDSHELFADPAPIVRSITDFLGVQPFAGGSLPHVNGYERPAMDDGLRARLAAQFEDSDRRLPALVGWVPSWR